MTVEKLINEYLQRAKNGYELVTIAQVVSDLRRLDNVKIKTREEMDEDGPLWLK